MGQQGPGLTGGDVVEIGEPGPDPTVAADGGTGNWPRPEPATIPEPLARLAADAALRVELTGRRGDVVLADPARRNAQTPATWRALEAAGQWLADRADVVVVRAEGPSFSAGLDRRAFTPGGIPGERGLHQLAALPAADLDAAIAEYQAGFAVWAEAPYVSIAAVHGHAVGAGFQLALACDLRIAGRDARFAMRETSLGLVPDLTGTWPLLQIVGYPKALEICATGRWVDADEALALGLVQQVVDVAGLATGVDRLVRDLLVPPPGAVAAMKALLRDGQGRDRDAQQAAERAAQAVRLRALVG